MRTNKADLRKAVIILGSSLFVSIAIIATYVHFGVVKLENLV